MDDRKRSGPSHSGKSGRAADTRLPSVYRASLRSCRCWGRLANRVHDLSTARALQPDKPIILTAIQLAAALMLSDEGHQGGVPGMGRGDYHKEERD